ncbi:class I SAM-dependent methyltransferase [Enhygromyxa salina]|uniref:Leucine carboxyl methyltransferase n=1 Tax=Enhygromyxa salina TaxID=215803 RepID=A0A2S9YVH4_9BACT|nr:class I SAM-dependent methyltransferase [Enhygromyxa salina]PRQ09049.1 Leucine carboxyl methyltransferase [Enhygromyxa salina]
MTDKQHVELGGVAETLMIPLWCRAVETERGRALLRDPKAREIVAQLDYDFDRRFAGLRALAFRACLRTVMIDRWVQAFLRAHPAGVVVEIGTGLNTRFERLDNGSVRWFDLDLPDSLALRRRFFTDSARRTMIEGAFGDHAWIDELHQQLTADGDHGADRPIMFVSEAVLVYLTEPTVRRGFDQLAEVFPASEFVFDTVSRAALAASDRPMMQTYQAPFVWGCDDPSPIEAWGHQLVARTTMAELPFAVRRRVPLEHRIAWPYLRLFRSQRLRSHALNRFRLRPAREHA